MDRNQILREGLVIKPFEARTISKELKLRVEYFQKLLKQKNNLESVRKTQIRSIHEFKKFE